MSTVPDKMAFAVIVLLWWVSMWGLIDLSIEKLTRTQKFIVFISLLGVVFILLQIFPEAIKII
jgi:hypothetical protein